MADVSAPFSGVACDAISFVIPAYNEESLIAETIERLHGSARALGIKYEIIVADDASTDATAQIATDAGAKVVSVNNRQIAATRNSGAAAASGDVLIFVDADTLVPQPTLAAAMNAIENGAIGGGALILFRGDVGVVTKIFVELTVWSMRLVNCCGGCFMFMRRDAFEAVGGYDEQYFASEEVWLARALARKGRFVVVHERTHTSSRKIRQFGLLRLLWLPIRQALRGRKGVRQREGLEVWYESHREPPGTE